MRDWWDLKVGVAPYRANCIVNLLEFGAGRNVWARIPTAEMRVEHACVCHDHMTSTGSSATAALSCWTIRSQYARGEPVLSLSHKSRTRSLTPVLLAAHRSAAVGCCVSYGTIRLVTLPYITQERLRDCRGWMPASGGCELTTVLKCESSCSIMGAKRSCVAFMLCGE
jgi:hypothetical protein